MNKYKKPFIDFSSNINPLGIHKSVKDSIVKSIDDCFFYPDPYCRELTELMSQKLNIKKEFILFGNGASDLNFKLIYAIKPKNALLIAPTFSEYENALSCVDCNINYYNLNEYENFTIDNDILDYITNDLDIMFLCNPNNPTGVATNNTLIHDILKKCKKENVLLVIDECFIEFLIDEENFSSLKFLNKYSNLIIFRAFTKIYAIPGLRLGYVLSSNECLLKKINGFGQPWSVSTLANASGIACIKLDKSYINYTKTIIAHNNNYFTDALKSLQFKVFKSQSNFILFKSDIVNLKGKLEKNGILIRSCVNYNNLNNLFYRVAVKKKEEIDELIKFISCIT